MQCGNAKVHYKAWFAFSDSAQLSLIKQGKERRLEQDCFNELKTVVTFSQFGNL